MEFLNRIIIINTINQASSSSAQNRLYWKKWIIVAFKINISSLPVSYPTNEMIPSLLTGFFFFFTFFFTIFFFNIKYKYNKKNRLFFSCFSNVLFWNLLFFFNSKCKAWINIWLLVKEGFEYKWLRIIAIDGR